MQDIELLVYDNFDDCQLLLANFKKYQETDNPFLRLQWLKLWWQHFGKNKQLYLILFFENKKPVGFAPLFYRYKKLFGVYEFKLIGDGFSSYLDIIYKDGYEEKIILRLIDHLTKKYKNIIVSFNDINDEYSLIYETLRKSDLINGFPTFLKLYPCPLAQIGEGWDQYFKRRGDYRSRYNLRKRSERVSTKFGNLKFYELTNLDYKNNIHFLIEQIEVIHKERFTHTINPLFSKETRAFIYSFLSTNEDLKVSLSIIELDGVPISFLIGFHMGEIFIDFAPGFDPAFATFGLGNIHLMKLIQLKSSQQMKTFDFSKGEAEYKRWWATDETSNYLIQYAFKLNMAGLFYFKCSETITKLKIILRENNYNTFIKNKLAEIKNYLFKRGKDKKNGIEMKEIVNHKKYNYFNKLKFLRWSYGTIKDLPKELREQILKLIIKDKIEDLMIYTEKDNKNIYLKSNNTGKVYSLKY